MRARQRHRQHRLARAGAAFDQQTRLAPQQPQGVDLLVGRPLQRRHRVIDAAAQGHQQVAIRRQQVAQHLLLRAGPRFRIGERLAQQPGQRGGGVGQIAAVEQEGPRGDFTAGQRAAPVHFGKPGGVGDAQALHRVAAEALVEFLDQRVAVAAGLRERRLLHLQPGGVEPFALAHLDRARLDLEHHQPVLRVENDDIRLADALAVAREGAPFDGVEVLPGGGQKGEGG